MLTKAPHLFDDATRVTAGDSCWQGRTSPDYWAFVGPFGGATAATVLRALIDHPQRAGDPLSLMSMSAAFFGRVLLARRELVPFGTVSITTYFHTASEDLAAEDITHVLAAADARIFHKSYGDQHGELWSPSGRLLATTTQIAYFKA